jgi:hypothetical protein
MGINDRIDNESEDRKDFLCELVAGIDLNDTLFGITMQVIDRGEASLSPKQKRVFKQHVLDVYVTTDCKHCDCKVRWFEMYQAYHNGGYCADCVHTFDK